MSVRPPRLFSTSASDPLNAALEYEILQEKAGTLGRLGRTLEKSLAALRAHDANAEMDTSGASNTADASRRQLVAEAAQALWYVVIQRELCGLPANRAFFDQYDIPPGVRSLMGTGPMLAKK